VLEVKSKLASLGRGVAFAVGAVVLFLFAFGFGAGTAAAGIATATSPWVGLLVVTFFLLLFAVLLGALAAWSIKKGAPPVPEQAIREAKLTSEVLKNDGSSQ
jgi:protein-S-isoprenylcysteine O-methyltransferase Ste14